MSTSAEMKLAAVKGDDLAFQTIVDRRRRDRFSMIDNLPPELRVIVNDYGWTVIKTCFDLGVKKPKHIRHLVETILNEFSPTRGSYSRQGKRTEVGPHPSAAALDE